MPKEPFSSVEGLNLPHSLEAEQSVLGSILIDAESLNQVADVLKAEHFYLPEHQLIYGVMIQKMMQNEVIDYVTVLEALKSEGMFSGEEGKAYLLKLAQMVPSVSSIKRYAEIVQQKSNIRKLIAASRQTLDEAMDPSVDFNTLIESAEQRVYDIQNDRHTNGLSKLSEAITENYEKYAIMSDPEKRKQYVGIPTGIPALDRVIGGLNRSNLIIIGARPGVGKTAFILNLARNVAVDQHRSVAIFNLEMSKEQLVNRLLSADAKVEGKRLAEGTLSVQEWKRVAASASVLSAAPIYVDDSTNITASDIKARLRRIPEGIDLVIVDYLQLMHSARKTENRTQEVQEITRAFKLLAKEMDVPVIVCAQLNRAAAATQERRPTLIDLRESGSIEQDGDQVMFLYRADAASNPTGNTDNVEHGTAEVIVAKNRHGENNVTIKMLFEGKYTQFIPIPENTDAEQFYEEIGAT